MNIVHPLTHRDMLGYYLNDAGLLGHGVEIGSAFGQFARRILSVWKGQKLTLVDPWENLPPEEYPEKHDGVPYEQWHKDCQALATEDSRVELVRSRSAHAIDLFHNSSLDFCYIDGNHSYANVMQDLDLWSAKVKPGGIICGHDFYNKTDEGHYCEVGNAVIRWMQEHGMPFTVTPCTSWFAIKQ